MRGRRMHGGSRNWVAWVAVLLLGITGLARAERVPLAPRLGALGMRETRIAEGAAVFSNRFHTVVVHVNSRRVEWDGVGIYLNGPVLLENNRWSIDRVDWNEGIGFPWIAVTPKKGRPVDVVLLDPGHGGADSGALSPRHVEEARVTMDVARRVGKLLQSRGITVRYTRDESRTLSLDDRIAINKKLKPDVFVAIHVNATANKAINGIETFITTSPGYQSTVGGSDDERIYDGNRNGVLNLRLAYAIQANLLNYTGAEDRGVKRARFAVIKHSPVPAVLVEMGFLTNSGEESLLISRVYRDRVAAGIARGILSYLTTQRKPPSPKDEDED